MNGKTVLRCLSALFVVPVIVSSAVRAQEAENIEKYRRSYHAQEELGAELRGLVTGNNAFALDLYRRIGENSGNVFFSPHSISSALAMTYAGARTTTASQMKQTLRFTLPQEKLHAAFKELSNKLVSREKTERNMTGAGFRLLVAQALWEQEGFPVSEDFSALLAENYGVSPQRLDFQKSPEKAASVINEWIGDRTERKITNILQPRSLTAETKLVLANTIYFEAKWSAPFVTAVTCEEPFFLHDGGSVTVPMMSQKMEFGYTEGDTYQALEKTYSADMSMVVLLPRPGCFEEFDRSLTIERIQAIIDGFGWEIVVLKLPAFSFESNTLGLKEMLIGMGMTDAFSSGADFSGISKRSGLLIQDVFHKATVTVNEEGTVAAAATVVAMPTGRFSDTPKEFTVNRPFIFLIRDIQTGAILFIGRILNPV